MNFPLPIWSLGITNISHWIAELRKLWYIAVEISFLSCLQIAILILPVWRQPFEFPTSGVVVSSILVPLDCLTPITWVTAAEISFLSPLVEAEI